MIVYGIKNCGTVRKAVDWLTNNNIPYEFHDYKKHGISTGKLQNWSKQLGAENLINRKGTTWRKLDENQKKNVGDETLAIDIMAENTSLIKRPIIEKQGEIFTVGFDENEFSRNYAG